MKLPAVASAAAFAGGIALGLRSAVVPPVAPALFPPSLLCPVHSSSLCSGPVVILSRNPQFADVKMTDGPQLEASCFVAGPSAAKASMLAKMPDQNQNAEKQ